MPQLNGHEKNYLQVVSEEIRDLWIEYSLGRIDIATPREIPVLAAASINRKYSQEEIAQMRQNAEKNPASSKTKQSKLQTLAKLVSFYRNTYLPGLAGIRKTLEQSITEVDKKKISRLRSAMENDLATGEKKTTPADPEESNLIELEIELTRMCHTLPSAIQKDPNRMKEVKALTDKYAAVIDQFEDQLTPLYRQRLQIELAPVNFIAAVASGPPEDSPERFKMLCRLQLLLLHPAEDDVSE